MTTRQELYIVWKHIAAVALHPNDKKFQNVPCEWKTFDEFYSKNYQRYYKAKLKWKNYKKVTPVKYNKAKGKYTTRCVHFVRKVSKEGFTKKNTVFTSASDERKYRDNTHKIIFDGQQLLGIRDVKNILKKNGIERSISSIIRLKNNNKSLFELNRLHKFFWKGKYMSLVEIAKKENINYGFLNNKICTDKFDLKDAVAHCKKYTAPLYSFEGENLYPHQIIEILSKRHNIKKSTLQYRFYNWGYDDIEKLVIKKSNNKFAPYPKKVCAEKDDKKQIFDSVKSMCEVLGIARNSANNYLYKKYKRAKPPNGYVIYFIK
jgi:hypothetical protein